jgi:hypothetical protein
MRKQEDKRNQEIENRKEEIGRIYEGTRNKNRDVLRGACLSSS